MKTPDNVALGERIRHLRKDLLGLDQAEFAAKLGVTRGAVGNWELGKGVKRHNRDQIVKTFNCSFYWLWQGTGTPFPDRSIDDDLAKLPSDEAEYLYEVARFMIELKIRLRRMNEAGITAAVEREKMLNWHWTTEPVAWRVKDFADGWILCHSLEEATREAESTGNLIQPLFIIGK